MKIQSERKLLTVQEVSEILSLKPRTIYNCTGRKAKKPFPIPVKRIGRLVRFDLADVERYIRSL